MNPGVLESGPRGYRVAFSMDASGREVRRTFELGSGRPSPELDDCVKKVQVPALLVAPPGKPTNVTVMLMLP